MRERIPFSFLFHLMFLNVDKSHYHITLKISAKRTLGTFFTSLEKMIGTARGADPVTQKTVDIALNVVENFPGDVGLPEVTADPHGRVDFDWHLNNGTMFTVSVGNDGEVAISGLYQGQSRLTGMAWDKDQEIPCLVHCGLNWLSSMKVR